MDLRVLCCGPTSLPTTVESFFRAVLLQNFSPRLICSPLVSILALQVNVSHLMWVGKYVAMVLSFFVLSPFVFSSFLILYMSFFLHWVLQLSFWLPMKAIILPSPYRHSIYPLLPSATGRMYPCHRKSKEQYSPSFSYFSGGQDKTGMSSAVCHFAITATFCSG